MEKALASRRPLHQTEARTPIRARKVVRAPALRVDIQSSLDKVVKADLGNQAVTPSSPVGATDIQRRAPHTEVMALMVVMVVREVMAVMEVIQEDTSTKIQTTGS